MYPEKYPGPNMHMTMRFGSFFLKSVGGTSLMDVIEHTQPRQDHKAQPFDDPYRVTEVLDLQVEFSLGQVFRIFRRNLD